MSKSVIVIGSGFAGLSAATHLAHRGYRVRLLEKNSQNGGRARSFSEAGFTFDMGPSWYWMPDVFEHYFKCFGKKVADYYKLERLDPSYRVYFGDQDYVDLPANLEELYQLFDSIEAGSGEKLRQFLGEAAYKYQVGINDLVYKPGRSLAEFADLRVLRGLLQLNLLQSMRSYVHKFFDNDRLRQIMEFPILFLGGTPKDTPALYSLMNYADMALGTWYPEGGMVSIVKAMESLAKEKGVEILNNQEVTNLEVVKGTIVGVKTTTDYFESDVVVAGADYHFVEQNLLEKKYRQYSESYWQKRQMAPSSLLFYVGLDKEIDGILHHTLCFDESFDLHAQEIYDDPQWPSRPLFYLSAASKTDPNVAPGGHENLMMLIPVAPGLTDDEQTRQRYFDLIMDRLEKLTGEEIRKHVVYQRSYAHRDFISDYNAFKGNAYGLANSLRQTAVLKPSMKSKKVKNLYYTGQLTVPGPGVPPSLISGEVVAGEIAKDIKNPVMA